MSDRRLKFTQEEITISEAAEVERGREILRAVEKHEEERRAAGTPRPPLFPHLEGTSTISNRHSAIE
jgi:hypothetical protein